MVEPAMPSLFLQTDSGYEGGVDVGGEPDSKVVVADDAAMPLPPSQAFVASENADDRGAKYEDSKFSSGLWQLLLIVLTVVVCHCALSGVGHLTLRTPGTARCSLLARHPQARQRRAGPHQHTSWAGNAWRRRCSKPPTCHKCLRHSGRRHISVQNAGT